MNLQRDLNARQREAVTHGDGPVLVLAGPGTGKTRVVIYRVAHLIESRRAEPGEILALTFTNKAAQELRDRVDTLLGESVGAEVWVGTFHHICSLMLRDAAERLELSRDFAIFDDTTQHAVLAECLRRAGLEADGVAVARVRDFISRRKAALCDPLDGEVELLDGDEDVWDDPDARQAVRDAVEEYAARLRRHGALDFDDLLVVAVEALREHADLRERYCARFRHVLVDEYQDINAAQYEFLRLLVPPPYRVSAVGDEDQSIYSWRGSSPEWLRRFRDDYRPHMVELDQHYRSTQTVLNGARELIERNERLRQGVLSTDNPVGRPVYWYDFADEEEEAKYVAQVLRGLQRDEHIAYRDMAVFYRNHRHAERLEHRLADEGIPVQRVRPPHQILDVSEFRLLAWLRFLVFGLDAHLLDALTFPANVLDEWSRVWFHWKAQKEGRSFVEVVGDLGQDVPPLTRRTLGRALGRMRRLQEVLPAMSASEAVRALLAELELHRSPFHADDIAEVAPAEEYPGLCDAADVLGAALRRGETPRIVTGGTLDDLAAGAILRTVLAEYFGVDAPMAAEEDTASSDDSRANLALLVGAVSAPSEAARAVWLHGPADSRFLCPRAPEGVPPVSAHVALRLCQRLLAQAERLEAPTVVYDLETTGGNPRRHEIVEIAATRLTSPEQHLHCYVRPRQAIPQFLTKVHGIDQATVRDKPPIEEQIETVRDFLGDAVLVGHNVAAFDNLFLERAMQTHLREPLRNPTYDTLSVAERLVPEANHSLTALAGRFGLPYEQAHRATHDVEVAKRLFHLLREKDLARRTDTCLPEYLPFLAIGALAKDAWDHPRLRAYRTASGRWLRVHEVRRDVLGLFPTGRRAEARRLVETARRTPARDTREEDEWQGLRARFLKRVTDFEAANREKGLRDYLNSRALAQPSDELDGSREAVTMMTLHSAKGAEFRAVVITGMEEGILPSFRSLRAPEMLAEERRLCYVGMTRARERLYLTRAQRRDGRDREPSRFLSEVPGNLMMRWGPRRRR